MSKEKDVWSNYFTMKTDSALADTALLLSTSGDYLSDSIFVLAVEISQHTPASKQGARMRPLHIFSKKKKKKKLSRLQKGFPSSTPVAKKSVSWPLSYKRAHVKLLCNVCLSATLPGYAVLTRGQLSGEDTADRYTWNNNKDNHEFQDFLWPLSPHSSLRKCI